MDSQTPLGLSAMMQLRAERFAEYVRSAALISQHPIIRRCEAVAELVDVDWYESSYFPKQSNMLLVRNKKLPGDLTGLVVRRDLQWRGEVRGLFLIQVATISNRFEEHFVVAHELGHVLAHGRLMYPGMVVSEASWEDCAEEDVRRRLVELEANIYALLSVVPGPAIDALHEVLRCEVSAEALKHALQWLGGEAFDLQLARERLLLHRVLHGGVSEAEFGRDVLSARRSWTLHGAAAVDGACEARAPHRVQAISRGQFRAWLRILLDQGVLNPNHCHVASAELRHVRSTERHAPRFSL